MSERIEETESTSGADTMLTDGRTSTSVTPDVGNAGAGGVLPSKSPNVGNDTGDGSDIVVPKRHATRCVTGASDDDGRDVVDAGVRRAVQNATRADAKADVTRADGMQRTTMRRHDADAPTKQPRERTEQVRRHSVPKRVIGVQDESPIDANAAKAAATHTPRTKRHDGNSPISASGMSDKGVAGDAHRTGTAVHDVSDKTTARMPDAVASVGRESADRRKRAASVPPFMATTGVAGSDGADVTVAKGHRHVVPSGHAGDSGTGDDRMARADDVTDTADTGMEPTRLMARPGGVTKVHAVPDANQDATHDDVATAYGMSGVTPPIPPVPPMDADARAGGGKRRGTPRKDARKRNIVIVAVIAVALVALGIAYGVGVSRYQSRLFPNTEIGGIDVSEMTAKEAAKATDTSGWHITIDDVTGDKVTIGKEDAGMSVSGASPSDMIASQDAFAWPLHVIGGSGRSVDRTVSFDYGKLRRTLSSLGMCDASKRTEATDASFRYDQGTGKWYVTPDAQGTVVDKDRLFAAVKKSLDGFNSPTVKITQDMCLQPSVTASDESLNSAVADANKWVSASVTYDIDDQQSAVTVDSKTIAPWVSIARGNDGRFSATLDESAVKAYLARIGDKYDTPGEPLTITTPTGKVASVAGTGEDTGWLTDEGAELPKLVSDIKDGRTDHREFSMKHRANAKTGSDVWGTTYIEVDLSSQHLWYVKDGKVAVDFGIISGKSGYDTPQGVTAVYKKVTNVTLISPWKDPKTGEPTYKTPIDVGLVISRDGNILIHSAPWQPSGMFGNAGYHVSGGSHGCVNAPTDKTWDLYNAVPLNTPVVVHS